MVDILEIMQSGHENAMQILQANAQRVIERILVGDVPARWHPTGFLVFHLGSLSESWRLRLHVWPTGIRQVLRGHPSIHSHNWELASLVLSGTYSDLLYSPDASGRLYTVHDAQSDEQGGTDIWPVGTARLTELSKRSVEAGSAHTIPAGQLHQTVVPTRDAVATLVMMGPVSEAASMLLLGDRFVVSGHRRPCMTMKERDAAFAVLSAI